MKAKATAAGTLGATVTEMFRLSRHMREAGSTEGTIAQYIEGVLRTSWPQTREWHYVCDQCRDTGWVEGSCTPGTPCGRAFRLPGARLDDYTGQGQCAPSHAFVRPCLCPQGTPHTRAYRGASTDIEQAGRRRGTLTRVGSER